MDGQRALNTWDRRDLEIERLEGENERLRERERAARAEAEDAKRRFSELTAASKRFASSMRGGARERQQYRRRLAAQLAVSRVLSEARDLDDAAPKVFEILGERLGWEVGVLWLPSGNVLRCAGEWRRPGAPPGAFEEACERSNFRRGVELPGRVWERGEPVWVEDVVEDADFSRKEAAAEDDLHGAFAFPIRDGGLVGVFELFRREALPPDDDLLRTAALIGDQIGQFVERRRAEEAVRRSQERAVFRATLADLLRSLTDPAEIMAEADRALGRHLEASRVTYGEGSSDGEVVSVTGRAHLDDYASALMGNLRAGRTVVVADVLDDPALTAEQRAAFEAAQIRAHVSVPLVKGGRLVGALGATQATARAWTADEVALVEETAEQTWAAVERARAEEALRQSEERFRTLFNSIDEGFCVVEMIFDENDRPIDYRFLEVSPSFEKQTGLVDAQGKRMRELAPQHEEHWFEVYGEIALTGKPARFENRAEQLHRWYDVYAFRFGEPANRQVAILFNDVTERKRTEARLRDSEERYRSLVTATSSIVWTAAPTGECVEEMPSWEEFTGQTFEQYRGFGWLDAVHPDDRPPADAWDNLDPQDAPLEVEYRLRRRDGEYRRVVSRAVPVFGADGGVREWVGTMLDVEERRRAEEANAYLAEVVRSSGEAVVGTSPDGTIESWNPAAERLFGYASEEAIGRPISLLSSPEQHAEQGEVMAALRSGRPVHLETVRVAKGGRPVHVILNVSPVLDAEGRATGLSATLTDITARKRAEEEREELRREAEMERARLEAILQQMPGGVFIADHSGSFVLANEGTERIYGRKIRTLAECSRHTLTYPEGSSTTPGRSTVVRALGGEHVSGAEHYVVRADGSRRIVSVNAAPVRDERGRVVAAVKVFEDVTLRKEAERALRESEERLRTLVEGAPVVLCSTDREGVFTLAVGRGHEALGIEPNSVVGRSIFDVFEHDPGVLEDARRALSGEALAAVREMRGGVWEITYAPLYDENGAFAGIIAVAVNVTERERAEEERARAEARERAARAEVEEAQRRLAYFAGAREERQMISRELHDRVAHSMAVVRQCLELYEALGDRDPEAAAAKMEQAKDEAKSALQATRDLSMMLRRSEIEGGLATALSDLLETTVPPNVRYEVSVEGEEATVPPHVANQVFLILREAIRNAVAHSGCKRVAVGIEVAPSGLTGSVEDDGLGLKAGGGSGKSNGGVGLRSMKERAALLGGAVRVSSKPNAGTKVEVSVPLKEEDVR